MIFFTLLFSYGFFRLALLC